MNRVKLQEQLEREQLQAEHLQELDQMKSRFFSNISHEFRTPLTLILGPAAQIAQRVDDRWIQKKTSIISILARRLLHFVNQILDLSRLEAGRMEFVPRSGNIIGIFRGITASFHSHAEERRIGLHFQSVPEHFVMRFDRNAIEQVLVNLLSNAFHFTEEGDNISVDVSVLRREKEMPIVVVKVRDTGCGIPPEKLARVFDRFYQAHEEGSRGGSGIGLALTNELIALHGGEIHVDSIVDEGTVFTFELPVVEGNRSDAAVEEPVSSDGRHEGLDALLPQIADASPEQDIRKYADHLLSGDSETGKAVILLVDDHSDLRDYIKDILEPLYSVIEAGNGEQGIERVLDDVPDLVISDVMMPVMDGFAFCRRIREDERSSHIPVIMLTARGDERSRVAGLEEGANEYLTKPFNPDELLLRVRNLIALRKALAKSFTAEAGFRLDPRQHVSRDQTFVDSVIRIIEERLDDDRLSPVELYEEIGMSRSQFQRKIKALTDMTPSRLIRTIRLERGREMLEQGAGSVAEVAYAVGFNSQSYFTSCFKEHFDRTPKQSMGSKDKQ